MEVQAKLVLRKPRSPNQDVVWEVLRTASFKHRGPLLYRWHDVNEVFQLHLELPWAHGIGVAGSRYKWSRSTIKNHLDALWVKGWVERKQVGRAHYYRAVD